MIIYWLYLIVSIFLSWILLKITKSKILVIIYYIITLIILFSFQINNLLINYYYKDIYNNFLECQYNKCLNNKDDVCKYDIFCNKKKLPYCEYQNGKCNLINSNCDNIKILAEKKYTKNIENIKNNLKEYHIDLYNYDEYIKLFIYLLPIIFVLFILKYLY